MKYITYKDFDGNQVFVIFDKITDHIGMSRCLPVDEVLGAGFVGFNNDGPYCYGESISMNVKSRKEKDSKIIKRFCPWLI